MAKTLLFVALIHSVFIASFEEIVIPKVPLAKSKNCEDSDFLEPPCCGAINSLGSRIKDGEPINPGEITWWVTVKGFPRGGKVAYIGIGSLISSSWVITAAHVAVTDVPSSVQIRFIENIYADLVIPYPFYKKRNTGKTFDMALVHMERPISFTKTLQPICLPLNAEYKLRDFVGENATVVGWGNGHRKRIVPIKLCPGRKPGGKSHITVRICVPNVTQRGDSGGPLMFQLENNPMKIKSYYVYGVLYLGYPKQSAYMRIDNVMEWIKGSIQAFNIKNNKAERNIQI